MELSLVNNDIDSHWARIPGCTATCVWCASVLFDVPSATSRKTCTDVTMACARPVRDPEMLALYHIPPLGPARGPFQRSRGAGGVPRGVHLNPSPDQMHPPGHPGAHMCSPRTASQFRSPAQSSPTGRAQQACHHARERERFVDGRFHAESGAHGVGSVCQPEVRLVLK